MDAKDEKEDKAKTRIAPSTETRKTMYRYQIVNKE